MRIAEPRKLKSGKWFIRLRLNGQSFSYTASTKTELKYVSTRSAKKNHLPEIGFHGLRHSFASLCYHLGLSELETMRLGGWSDPAVIRKIYTHLAQSDLSEGARKLQDFFSR